MSCTHASVFPVAMASIEMAEYSEPSGLPRSPRCSSLDTNLYSDKGLPSSDWSQRSSIY
ncbi:HrpA-like helicase [Giardia duodenalis]|uniref:HrpA-like helicase n=1 Tax=Giardia intestinalis TaxID=5741 RepID=V6TB87_GIAIN|nr:HrpA-like helicase [Giardia intestinalis]